MISLPTFLIRSAFCSLLLCALAPTHCLAVGGGLVTLSGELEGDNFGQSVSGAGDVNGDGFADVIVGAHLNDAGGGSAGRAYVFYGGPAADGDADLTLGGNAGSHFGISVSAAGDVNGDGFGDVIVGAYLKGLGGPDGPAAYVYFGGPGADALADLTFVSTFSSDSFGRSVSGAGDVNRDGFDDVIVGAPVSGRALVFYGGPGGGDTIPDLVFTGEAASDNFGSAVAGAGDFNSDGFDDMIVGAVDNDAGGRSAGRAYVFFGGVEADTIADVIMTGEAFNDMFGFSVSAAGDFNDDGFDDLIVGSTRNDSGDVDAGRAYIYYGGHDPDGVVDLVFTGEGYSARLGIVSAAGDVNGDGVDDVIVGAGITTDRAYVYYGDAEPDNVSDITLSGPLGTRFGDSVSGAGDFDGDGSADVVVGASFHDFGTGRVRILSISSASVGVTLATTPRLGKLSAPRPNPLIGSGPSTFQFSLVEPASVKLVLYDVSGRVVAERAPETLRAAGTHVVSWNPGGLPSGTYYVRLVSSTGVTGQTRWVVIR